MKVTYNWLKDFVEIKISPKALADKLTMAGLEVTSLEKKDSDFVFEIEVTTNRPDCLSVIGIAREVAAITGKKLKLSPVPNLRPSARGLETCVIEIGNKKDCFIYIAKIIKDVKVGQSPDWLKKRLELVGCRSVNSVVDITNYILLEWGQPLHAFDSDKLVGNKIIVRRAKDNEKIITIDQEARGLDRDILLIADSAKPLAIAGIMGGKETEVSFDTKNILLEAAVFNPIIIRRGRQKLGIQSESGYRFERGVDLERVGIASSQAVRLIQEISGGRYVLAKSCGAPKRNRKRINLDIPTVHKILGVNIVPLEIKSILDNLGFKIRPKTRNNLSVEIPSHRQDVNLEIDLIEEIARIFGYEHMPKTLPALIPQISASDIRSYVSFIKNILVGLGLNETITYGLTDKDLLEGFKTEQSSPAIEILNPLSKDQAVLRPTLIPSLARCIAYNLNQKQDYINIFEVAKTFSGRSGQSQEGLSLGIALCGIKSWFIFEQGLIKEKAGFLHLKGILEALFSRLGIKDYYFTATEDVCELAVHVKKERIGIMAGLAKDILEHLDIKNKDVWVAELSLDRLFSCVDLKKRFTALPIYPGISRDISLILKDNIKIDDILEVIRQKGKPLLQEVKVIDYYKGQQIPAGFKGLTISCLYRSGERTLTEAEINPIHALVSDTLAERFQAKIR